MYLPISFIAFPPSVSPRRLLSSMGAKSQGTPVTPETQKDRRASKGEEFATLFPGNGLTRSPDLANSPKLSPVKDVRRRSFSTSPKKIPRSPNSSIGSSPGKSVSSPQKTIKPSPAREVQGKGTSHLTKASRGGRKGADRTGDTAGGNHPESGGGIGTGVACDDDDMTAMLSDIRQASSAYADVESWVVNESLSSETAAPLSQLLSGFGGTPTDTRTRSTFSKGRDKERGGTRDKQAEMETGSSRDISLLSRGSVREAWQPSSMLTDRAPFSMNFSYTPPKNYPFGVKEVKERIRLGPEGLGAEWASVMQAVGHPGSLHRLGRTMYGKLLLEDCRAWLRDWLFISVGRQRLRLAAKMQVMLDPELRTQCLMLTIFGVCAPAAASRGRRFSVLQTDSFKRGRRVISGVVRRHSRGKVPLMQSLRFSVQVYLPNPLYLKTPSSVPQTHLS